VGVNNHESGRFVSREGLYLAFGGFFDLKTEANFCLKEVLELVEKMEDLELEGIVKVWTGGGVVVMVFEGTFVDEGEPRKLQTLRGLYKNNPTKTQGSARRFVH